MSKLLSKEELRERKKYLQTMEENLFDEYPEEFQDIRETIRNKIIAMGVEENMIDEQEERADFPEK